MKKAFTFKQLGQTEAANDRGSYRIPKILINGVAKLFLPVALFFLLQMQAAVAQGPGSGWGYYRPITLNPTTPNANYQVKVTLSAGQYSNMNSTGNDLRFYDDANNNCPYWIESWNTSGNSVIWVKVPTTGTDVLILYYGNPSAPAVSSGSTTFDFFDDFTSSLGANWTTITSGGSVIQSGSAVTLSNTNGGTVSLSNTTPFTPATSSFFLETKHKEVGYNRNRFYATTSTGNGCPAGLLATNDYGYFSSSAGTQTSSKIYWNGSFTSSTLLSNNTDYLTRWQITDGSTYNWYSYNYATGAALDATARNTTYASNIRYISILVTEVASTSVIVDWVRVRQYAATEPVATMGGQNTLTAVTTPAVFTSSGNFIVPSGVTSITVQCWGAGGGGSTITSYGARGGGGGGGAFASSILSVSPGNIFPVAVGTGGIANTAGTNSTFNTTSVVAAGGRGGTSNSATAGAGGTTASSTGTTKYAGGNGAAGGSTYSGGGGGGAGTSGAGGNSPTAAAGSFGTGTTQYGGNGGASVSGSNNGNTGSNYGGGGSGAVTNSTTDKTGGSGAKGQVIISWCIPPSAPVVTGPVNYCLNDTATPLSATGSNLLWYLTPTGGTGSSTAPTPSTSIVGTTSYYVSQTIDCESPRARIDVIVYAPFTTINGQTNISCNGGSDGTITILANGGVAPYQFSVNNGASYTSGANPNPYTVIGLGANIQYKIRVKDSTGCQSPAIP